jgi:transcriptional regulator with XRE-family HTH domain
MSTQIAKQISIRMRAKNLSLTTLEEEAGLRPHAVQNILRGKSKKPSAELLQAVADVLGCNVKDLLRPQELYDEEELASSKKAFLNHPYEHLDLFVATVKFVNAALQEKDHSLTIEQFMKCLEEIYIHSLQVNPKKVDEEFAEWWIDLATD